MSDEDITEIWKFNLRKGNSTNPREGACLLDAVSWLEYGTLGDYPPCVCPVIAAFGRIVNDAMGNKKRQRLKVYIPRLVGTYDPEHEQERAEYLAWQAIQVFTPIALDAAGYHEHAALLRDFSGSLCQAVKVAHAYISNQTAEEAAGILRAVSWAPRGTRATATWAGTAAKTASRVVGARSSAEDAMIAALGGVLAIGRQAEPIGPTRFATQVRAFEMARGG